MKRISHIWILSALAFALSAGPALATAAEVQGKVVDHEGNPVKGAEIRFFAASAEDRVYKGKSNKKGRFFIPGLLSGQERDTWSGEIVLEGYVATEAIIENRTSAGSLLGDKVTFKMRPGRIISKLPIQPFGKVRVNFTIVPQAVYDAEYATANIAQGGSAGGAAGGSAGSADPATPAPPPPSNEFGEALTMVESGDYEGAIAKFDAAMEDDPEDAEKRGAYAQVLYRMERYDAATEQIQKAIALEPENLEHRMLNYSIQVRAENYDAAGTALDEAEALAPSNVSVLKQRAFLAGAKGDSPGAIAALEKVVETAPKEAESWANLGDLYAKAGDNAKSEAAYGKVVELQPGTAYRVFFNLGQLAIKADDSEKAVTHFKKAVELKPDYAQAHRELGFALLNTGNVVEAKASLQAYLDLAGDSPEAASIRPMVEAMK